MKSSKADFNIESVRVDFPQYPNFETVLDVFLKFPNLLSLTSYDHRKATWRFLFGWLWSSSASFDEKENYSRI